MKTFDSATPFARITKCNLTSLTCYIVPGCYVRDFKKKRPKVVCMSKVYRQKIIIPNIRS